MAASGVAAAAAATAAAASQTARELSGMNQVSEKTANDLRNSLNNAQAEISAAQAMLEARMTKPNPITRAPERQSKRPSPVRMIVATGKRQRIEMPEDDIAALEIIRRRSESPNREPIGHVNEADTSG